MHVFAYSFSIKIIWKVNWSSNFVWYYLASIFDWFVNATATWCDFIICITYDFHFLVGKSFQEYEAGGPNVGQNQDSN